MSSSPFDWLKSVTHDKKDIMFGDAEEKQYTSFMTNRGLSYHQDTVLLANEMNRASFIDSRMQYDFLLKTIRPRKRFSKWHKKSNPAEMEVIKEYYGYSDAKAESVADLISADDIKHMKSVLSKGGKKR
jgi:hypothetical protein